jgi:hypothetical protein
MTANNTNGNKVTVIEARIETRLPKLKHPRSSFWLRYEYRYHNRLTIYLNGLRCLNPGIKEREVLCSDGKMAA